jgi:hypothetical protein
LARIFRILYGNLPWQRPKPNNCQRAVFLYRPGNATWADNDDFLAFTVNRERRRLDFDERFEAFLFSIEAV